MATLANPVITQSDYATILRKFNNLYKPKQITVDESKNYTEEEMVALIKQLPDYLRFPIPESWHDKYDIPRVEPISFQEALHSCYRVMFSDAPTEIRPPAEGGVREMPVLTVDATTQTDPESKPQEEVASSD